MEVWRHLGKRTKVEETWRKRWLRREEEEMKLVGREKERVNEVGEERVKLKFRNIVAGNKEVYKSAYAQHD